MQCNRIILFSFVSKIQFLTQKSIMISLKSHLRKLTKLSVNRYLFSGSHQNGEKVQIDEASIQRKMRELKQKGQVKSPQQLKRSKAKQFMPTFTIPQINKKINEFRRQTGTEDLFSFSDITLQQKPTVLTITGYENEFIQIDNFEYPPSVILTPNQVLNWEVESPDVLKIEDFALLKCMQPIPDYVIIGVPDSSVIKQDLRDKLKKIHSNIDILDLFEAISQYNTVTSNDKYCVAYLMSC